MLLSELLKGLPAAVCSCDGEITDVVSDSRKVNNGSLFVCIKGARFDGHSAAAEVLEKGAAAVVVDHDLGLERQVIVSDTREALAKLCSEFFGRPQDKLRMIAVTGTNGKTTIANVIKKSLEFMGHTTGLIGTIGSEIGDISLPARYTTPEPWELEMLLAKMVRSGCEYAVMEASSQALDQGRLKDIHYECAVYTNLSRDHLDYHKTFENYLAAKKLLFDISDRAVVNIDDEAGKGIAKEIAIPVCTYALSNEEADIKGKDLDSDISGTRYTVDVNGEKGDVYFHFPGEFSVYNSMACIGALSVLGFPLDECCRAVSSVSGVAGRCEVLHSGEATVISDYAHTDDALRKLLSSLKPYTKGRLIALYGCAGKRDKTKRVPMTQAVIENADYVIFSSDNPRDEEPFSIMKPLLHFAEEAKLPYAIIPDRFYAINWMLRELKPGDVFVLCCKGHEDYQVIDKMAVYLDERRIVRDYYSNKK